MLIDPFVPVPRLIGRVSFAFQDERAPLAENDQQHVAKLTDATRSRHVAQRLEGGELAQSGSIELPDARAGGDGKTGDVGPRGGG